MKYFAILRDQATWGKPYDYLINATHRWSLPGVRCTIEGPWAMAGLAYPSVDLSGIANERAYTTGWPVSLAEFEALRDGMKQLVPGRMIPPPGTQFGPLVGRAVGRMPDFIWQPSDTLLIRETTLARLEQVGISLHSVETLLKFGRGVPSDLKEIEILPAVRLAAEALPPDGAPPCPVCGRRGISAPDRLAVVRDSILDGVPLLRGDAWELPTFLFASEAFRQAYADLKLTGAEFDEVRLV